MRSSSRVVPRHDPKTIFEIHADRDTGMTTAEIAAKHDLPPYTVQTLLRPVGAPHSLTNPYGFAGDRLPPNAAVQAYWLGYIGASGRVFGQSGHWTLILSIHPSDEGHMRLLVSDLVADQVRVEFADSSLNGRQVYIRDRGLAGMLIQWGLAADPADGSMSLEFLPAAYFPDFVRGYLEGSRLNPPFGGSRGDLPSPRSVRSLAFVGAPAFVESLNLRLQSVCGTSPVGVQPFGRSGLSQIVLGPSDSTRVLESAYRNATRTGPRAAKFVARFASRQEGSPPKRPKQRVGT